MQSIVNDPKSWGRVKPDLLAQLKVRCHAELEAIFANPKWQTMLLEFMHDSKEINFHLNMKPPF